jgi:hypothetical protein
MPHMNAEFESDGTRILEWLHKHPPLRARVAGRSWWKTPAMSCAPPVRPRIG